jgi:hypothetical protein
MKYGFPVASVLAALAFTFCAMCGSFSASIDNETSPCIVLNAECPLCTQPGPKQECQTAVASADDVQCIAVLDDPAVIASCASDGGAEGGGGDGGTLPPCSTTRAAPEAGCACTACSTSCPEGRCDITCAAGGGADAACAPSCEGGGCTVRCSAGATCEATCTGGSCLFLCATGSTCENSCAGGGCTTQCADDAVCGDSCAVDAGCVVGF